MLLLFSLDVDSQPTRSTSEGFDIPKSAEDSTEQGLSIRLRLSEPKKDANIASGVSEIIPRCEGKAYIATRCQRAVAGQPASVWLGIHVAFEWGTFCLRFAISATSGAHCIYGTSFTSRLIKIYY